MLKYKTGDIFAEDADALVNAVNCVGVMGHGIALQFKKNFPTNFDKYREACLRGEVKIGQMFVVSTGQMTSPRYIINFPTKRHWRDTSRMQDIEDGLESLVKVIGKHNIRAIAIPPLGCGLGGLEWNEVRPRVARTLGKLGKQTHATIFVPNGVSNLEIVCSK